MCVRIEPVTAFNPARSRTVRPSLRPAPGPLRDRVALLAAMRQTVRATRRASGAQAVAMALLRGALANLLIACWVLWLLPASAQSLQAVSVIVFPGGFNWPIWVAQEHGYFAKSGVEVTLTNTPNSVFQVTNLMESKFDIAVTAIDNVIAYVEGQGEVPLASPPDLFAFMGGDN